MVCRVEVCLFAHGESHVNGICKVIVVIRGAISLLRLSPSPSPSPVPLVVTVTNHRRSPASPHRTHLSALC